MVWDGCALKRLPKKITNLISIFYFRNALTGAISAENENVAKIH